jgi:hypothetical protein
VRIAWPPILLGLACLAAGLWFLSQGWKAILSEGVASGAASLTAGVLLALLGVLMAVVPLLVPVLFRLYGDQAFTSRSGACPVVSKCPRCAEFNFRGRPTCKACGLALQAPS